METPVKVVIVTLDRHLSGACERAEARLRTEMPGLTLSIHAASDWATNPMALEECKAAVLAGDIILTTMLFMEDHIRPILPTLEARRDSCDAMIACMAAGDVVKLTKMGGFNMNKKERGLIAMLKRLRGSGNKKKTAGAHQMAMLRRLPKILKFIPGSAQDVRAYFITMQFWLAASEDNVVEMCRYLIGRYAEGERKVLRGAIEAGDPVEYPEVGVYHPDIAGKMSADASALPSLPDAKGRVGLVLMRSYLLSGDAGHYDGAIRAMEAAGLDVVPVFATGLDSRPALDAFLMKDGRATVDVVVSLTGFSLVGGPAYNDSKAAEDALAAMDVPYLAAHALEFQSIEEWGASTRGLSPIEATMMVAIPEIDGASGPMVFGGRSNGSGDACQGCARGCIGAVTARRAMQSCPERAEMLAARVAKLVALRKAKLAERKVGVVLFNFPPNAGATGTAAFLGVFESLFNTLCAMKREGYSVEVPKNVEALRSAVLEGNAAQYGTDANVGATISADDYVRNEPYLAEIEAQWGAAPGRHQTNGRDIFVMGAEFGNVFVGVQPAFGYEGDPMRLLFEGSFAPTHAFTAFYRWMRNDFGANAVLHFGTHGALEFMPGRQTGLSATDWPDRLIGDLPNIYLYAANNPSEGMLAKRRSAATLVSYLTPPVATAGLYKGLVDLKSSIDRWRKTDPAQVEELAGLADLIHAQAVEVDLAAMEDAFGDAEISALSAQILELEYTLIPHGLHVLGEAPSDEERIDTLDAMEEAHGGERLDRDALVRIVGGETVEGGAEAASVALMLAEDHEIPALLHALDGGFIRPAPGGDLLRTPDILPTGRNVHGFDPFRLPSAFAIADGAKQADRLIARHVETGQNLPETVAIVLWGTDNLKNEGAPIAQVLALMGAVPRFDSYGRLAGAELLDLETLGRPRIDVVATLSGIFRDLLPLQSKMLAEAAYLAATADEPLEQNFIRAHALAHMEEHGCDMETAALRVFSNAEGAYGSNVNQLIDSGAWSEEDELADAFSKRKCFAYGRDGKAAQQPGMLASTLGTVDLAYQNLESVELGVTTIDHYFDTLGGIGRAVKKAKGTHAPVYIGDQTRGEGTVRTLAEQVSLETRSRALNPKWYEGMLKHGHEGVRQIESHVTNTMGWSATTDEVAPWVYQQLTQTFVLDEEMRERLADLNPKASVRMANRLIEAHERNYWTPDPATLEALRAAGEALEDRLEGVAA